MFTMWIFLAIPMMIGIVMFVSGRLLKASLAHEGLCPVCGGAGGPCEHCNGFGMIVDASKTRSLISQADETTQAARKSLK